MSVRNLTCAERDAILHENGHYEGWSVVSSLTDAHGEFGEPRIETTWGRDGVQIRDVRHPRLGHYSPPDERPCEHYEIREEQDNE